jgi:hypothetical protein
MVVEGFCFVDIVPILLLNGMLGWNNALCSYGMHMHMFRATMQFFYNVGNALQLSCDLVMSSKITLPHY